MTVASHRASSPVLLQEQQTRNTSKQDLSEERSIAHLPRSKGALNPTHPGVPCGQSKRVGTGKLCCPTSEHTDATGEEGRGVSLAWVPIGPSYAISG